MSIHSARASVARLLSLPVAALVLTVGACSDEAAAPHSHTPDSAKLFVADVDVTANLTLPAGAVTLVVVKFYDDEGDEITTIEADHFAALVFTPGVLATPVVVVDQHFQFNVTAQATTGAGSVMVGYGHAADDTDDLIFGPFPVTVP